jgi:hypothetical protein
LAEAHPDARNLDNSPVEEFHQRLREYNIHAQEVQDADLAPSFNRVREECPVARGEVPTP